LLHPTDYEKEGQWRCMLNRQQTEEWLKDRIGKATGPLSCPGEMRTN
jgi:hypothetical protein